MPGMTNGSRIDSSLAENLPRLDRIILLYLAVPSLLFAFWLQPLPAVVLVAGLAVGLAGVLRGLRASQPLRLAHPAMIVPAVVAAVAWSCLGGAGHVFYSNLVDWEIRDAVARDLATHSWPVTYVVDGVAWVLRAPIGYFLPAGALGTLGGVATVDAFALVWTVSGVLLLLLTVTDGMPSWRRLVTAIGVVVFFSGLDVLPYLGLYQTTSASPHLDFAQGPLTRYMEFWSRAYQYSSNTTALFWAPNHGLPGWMAAAFLYRNWDRPGIVRHLGFLLALIPIWSPLTAIGLAPLVLVKLMSALRRKDWRGIFSPANVFAAPAVGGPASLYLIQGVASVPGGTQGDRAGAALLLAYVMLILVEVVPWLWVLERLKAPWTALIQASVVVLAVLPMFNLGVSNDLVMRASIPALMVLCLAVCDRLRQGGPLVNSSVLAVVALIGAATPATEMARSLTFPHWPPRLNESLADVQLRNDGELAPHYFAPAGLPGLKRLLSFK